MRWLVFLFVAVFGFGVEANAQQQKLTNTSKEAQKKEVEVQELELKVNQYQIIKLPQPAAVVMQADPQPFDIKMETASSYMLLGLANGESTLDFYDSKREKIASYLVSVVPNGDVTIQRYSPVGGFQEENVSCSGSRCRTIKTSTRPPSFAPEPSMMRGEIGMGESEEVSSPDVPSPSDLMSSAE